MNEKETMKELPEGWKWVKLGEACERITKGGTPTTYGFKFQNSGIRFLKIENVKNGRVSVDSIKDFISEEAHQYQKKSQLCAGDLLFSIAGTIGETCAIIENYLPANTNQAFAIIRGAQKHFDLKFLQYQLESFVAKIKAKARGGAMNNVSLEDLKGFDSILPPKLIQQAIVSKIEELFSEIDKGIEGLKTARQQLKTYRQAVLKWAFEGRLNHDSYDSPDEHDLSVAAEHEMNYKEKTDQDNHDNLFNHGSDNGALPVGWKWVKTNDVIHTINNGYTPTKEYLSEGSGEIPFIKVYNLNFDGTLNFTKNPTFIPKAIHDKELKRSICFPGDVLINASC